MAGTGGRKGRRSLIKDLTERGRRLASLRRSAVPGGRGARPAPGAVPPQRERHRRGDEQAAGGREPGGEVFVLADDREGGRQMGERPAELAGVLRAVEPAAGGLRDVHERVVVGLEGVAPAEAAAARLAAEAAAAETAAARAATTAEPGAAEPAELVGAARERRGAVGAVADGEDADAPPGCLLRRGLRVDP